MVIERLKSDACVLVTDGKSDARVVPLLKNRIKVNSVDMVRMKQAEQLENTYFTVLEKLKEPHYARIVFGIPAVLLLLFALSYYFKLGWELPVALDRRLPDNAGIRARGLAHRVVQGPRLQRGQAELRILHGLDYSS